MGAEAEPVLQQHPVAGCEVIRRGRGQHNGIDRVIAEAGRRQGDPAGALGKVDAGLTLAYPMPLADAGALRDPLIGGIHDHREVVIGDDAVGDGHAGAENDASRHGYRSGVSGERAGRCCPPAPRLARSPALHGLEEAGSWTRTNARTRDRLKRSRSSPVPIVARRWRSPWTRRVEQQQEYVEDCPVCCQPWQVHVEVDSDGRVHVWADAADE